jgi:hypothetical protein
MVFLRGLAAPTFFPSTEAQASDPANEKPEEAALNEDLSLALRLDMGFDWI